MCEPLPAARPAPRSATELFVTCAGISMQSFGGALAVVERMIVRHKRWLDAKEFVGVYGISQVLPDPTGISLCVLLGDRFFGLRGAAAALAGFLLLPAVIVIGLTTMFQQFQHLPWEQGALHGIGVALLALAAVSLGQLPVSTVVLTLGVASAA